MKNLVRTSIVAATVLAGANMSHANTLSADPEEPSVSQQSFTDYDTDEEGGFIAQKYFSKKAPRRDVDDVRRNKSFKSARRQTHPEDFLD